MSDATMDVIGDPAGRSSRAGSDEHDRRAGSGMPRLAGASPAVPRDPRLLEAEAADQEARTAAEQAEAARQAAADAEARAVAAKEAAARSKAQLEAARAEAKAKAEAAALQVQLERQEQADAYANARRQQRAQRNEQLGTVAPVEDVEPEVVTVFRRSTDRVPGALGLLLLRLVLAGWLAIVGWQALVNRQVVLDGLAKVGLGETVNSSLAWGAGVALMVAAAFLLFGIGTRVIAALVFLGTAAFLAFFRFGPFSPFLEGQFGFYGDREVFVAVMALLLVLIGAGGWSLDGSVRRRRESRAQLD